MRQVIHGHFWTLLPQLAHTISPEHAPRDEPWETHLDDPTMGRLRLTGWIKARPHHDTLFVLIHGLGGSHDSRYVLSMARACDRAGVSYMRFNMRGADRSGEDIYHAGTTEDLRAMLRSPSLRSFTRIYLIGFSLGGHIVMRWALDPGRDPRVAAIATVCAPLDLAFGAAAIQRPLGRPYQWHILNGLKEMYAAAKLRGRPLPVTVERVRGFKTIFEWDDEVVVPRFGFASRHDYYTSQAAGPRLSEMALPTLFIAAEADPVVTAEQIRPWIAQASPAVQVAWTGGGHIGFPHLTIDGHDEGPLEPQVLRWLLRQ